MTDPGRAALTYDPTSFSQTRDIGFFERVGASLLGIPIGIALIFFPISLLWWNEHRDVEAQLATDLALTQVVTVAAGPIVPANDGRLVHVVGPTSAGAITDPALGVTLPAMVAVQRRVEMYQWRERQSQASTIGWGGGQSVTTTVAYDKVWSGEWLDSRMFRAPQGHINPPMPARPALLISDDAKLGDFRLGPSALAALPSAGFQEIRPEKAPSGFVLDPVGGGLFRGKDPSVPSIGDVHVTYAGVPAGRTLTVVARQSGGGFTDQPLGRGNSVLLAAVGERSAQSLLDEKADREATLTWMVRLGGVVVMAIGFMLLLGPLATLVSVVPVLGALASGITFDIAFALAAMLGAVTIAVAWLVVHPLISIGLIVAALAVGGLYILIRRG